ncbi:MAG TPA: Ig-like domain-containing protein [Tepidiformaceae bacterium]|nr:Ig-like domain-containing protein [Tepidiformaceae bacterium]
MQTSSRRQSAFPFAAWPALLVAAVIILAAFSASAHDVAAAIGQPSAAAARRGAHSPQFQKQGILTIVHADDFVRGKSSQALVIHEDNGVDTPVRFSGATPKLGARISVTGATAADGTMDVSSTSVLSEATSSGPLAMLSTQNAIFILVKFLDTASVPFTQADVQAVAVTNANSVTNFYPEVSYGKQGLNITVTPWLTASMNTSTSCDYTSIANAANSAAAAAGYALSNYKNKFYVMPHNSACGWSGLAYVGSPYQAWSNGYNSGQVYTHELGHNFGLYHAGSASCLSSGCSVSEYGDPYDTMGNKAMMHYDSTQKAVLGWLPSSAVVTHTGGTANYTLYPFEASGGATYAVKIAAASNRTYWLEYRQPLGFDASSTGGVQFRVAAPFASSSGSDDTEIFNSGFGLAGLPVGSTYTDATYGISVTVLSASASGATIQVSSSALTATSTALSSSINPAAQGSSVTFTASVTGNSPTGSVSFTANGSALCSAALSSGAAKCSSSSLSSGSNSIVATYGGDSSNAASTSPTLSQMVSSVTDTTPPVVTITSPANGATVASKVTIKASATDNVGVVSLTVSIDGAVVATTNTGSLSFNWNTRKAANGSHTIAATAKDAAGNQATTSITVKK